MEQHSENSVDVEVPENTIATAGKRIMFCWWRFCKNLAVYNIYGEGKRWNLRTVLKKAKHWEDRRLYRISFRLQTDEVPLRTVVETCHVFGDVTPCDWYICFMSRNLPSRHIRRLEL